MSSVIARPEWLGNGCETETRKVAQVGSQFLLRRPTLRLLSALTLLP